MEFVRQHKMVCKHQPKRFHGMMLTIMEPGSIGIIMVRYVLVCRLSQYTIKRLFRRRFCVRGKRQGHHGEFTGKGGVWDADRDAVVFLEGAQWLL